MIINATSSRISTLHLHSPTSTLRTFVVTSFRFEATPPGDVPGKGWRLALTFIYYSGLCGKCTLNPSDCASQNLIFLAYFDSSHVHFAIFKAVRLYCPTFHLNSRSRLVLSCIAVSELLGYSLPSVTATVLHQLGPFKMESFPVFALIISMLMADIKASLASCACIHYALIMSVYPPDLSSLVSYFPLHLSHHFCF